MAEMSISERILALAKEKNVKQKVIAETCNVAQSTVTTWLKSGTLSIPSAYILPICRLFDCSPYYLLSGEEVEAPGASEADGDEEKLLRLFRSLDWEGRCMVISAAIAESRAEHEVPTVSINS